jgi:UDP-glucuronate 4-epimerase
MKILVTGGAGFIGSYMVKALAKRGEEVVIVDNFSDIYKVQLKKDRIKTFLADSKFKLYKADITDKKAMEKIFKKEKFDKVLHLAAMAGVRYSIENPYIYEEVNVKGSMILMELAVKYKIKHFVFASSSSVYGANPKAPFTEEDKTEQPVSFYAATKKSQELMAYVYHQVYGLKISGLRYFTVYGEWGRPNMAYYIFTDKIFNNQPIEVFNNGKMKREFTYIDDIVLGSLKVLDKIEDYEIYNIGGGKSIELIDFIETIEEAVGKKAPKKYLKMQPGDVVETVADISKLKKLGWQPKTDLKTGIKRFVDWYREYHLK